MNMNYYSFSFILAINTGSFYGKKPTGVSSQQPKFQLRFTDDADLSEDDLIQSSSDDEEIVDDVALFEPESEKGEQMSSSNDEVLINFRNCGHEKKKVKKPMQPSCKKGNLQYNQDGFLLKTNYKKEIDEILNDLGIKLSYFFPSILKRTVCRDFPTIIITMNPVGSDFWDTL